MNFARITFFASALCVTTDPSLASELTGPELLTTLSGRTFDCRQGDVPLEWRFANIAPDQIRIPYTALVRGKTIEAEYEVTPNGRISSDGYGAERVVTIANDGTLTVTRTDGRSMTCLSR